MFKFPKIYAFHNVIESVKRENSLSAQGFPTKQGISKIFYCGKIKLHGTNAGIHFHKDGRIIPQSRNYTLCSEPDGFGFASWVFKHKEKWKMTKILLSFLAKEYEINELVIFGEWCGKGMQKDVAISKLDKRIFAIFSIYLPDYNEYVVCPEYIEKIIKELNMEEDVEVLPWETEGIECNFYDPAESLETINKWVNLIEEHDPYVKRTFDIDGVGEGIVFTPVDKIISSKMYELLIFKAKGKAHRESKQRSPVIENPEQVRYAEEFVEKHVTSHRIEKAIQKIMGVTPDIRKLGRLIGEVCKDLHSEVKSEADESNLDWKLITKKSVDKVKNYFFVLQEQLDRAVD